MGFSILRHLVVHGAAAALVSWLWLGAAAAAAKERIAVAPVAIDRVARPHVPAIINEAVLSAVQETALYDAVGLADIDALLGHEKTKDLLACEDAVCTRDLAGSLDLDRLLALSVALVDGKWFLSGKLIHVRAMHVERRHTRLLGGDTAALFDALPVFVRELVGLLPPGQAKATAQIAQSDAYQARHVWFGEGMYYGTPGAAARAPAFKGKDRELLSGAELYAYVGREDLAASYRQRVATRWALLVGGVLVQIAGAAALALAPPDSGNSGSYLMVGGIVAGGAATTAGWFFDPHPATDAEAKKLALEFNRRLANELAAPSALGAAGAAAPQRR